MNHGDMTHGDMSGRVRAMTVRGQPASYREAGHGPAVIIAEGLGLTGHFYERSLAAFADAGLRLIVPDLPGFGQTKGPLAGVDPEEAARFLLDFADAVGVRVAVWVGHSLGAQVVAELAAMRPDRARGVVLVGPTGAPGRMPRLRQAWGLAREALRAGVPVIGAVARDYVRANPIRYIGTWLRHSENRLLDTLPRIQSTTLLLAGDADPLCTPEYVSMIAQRLRHGSVRIISGGTHALPRGSTDAFNREVIRFALSL